MHSIMEQKVALRKAVRKRLRELDPEAAKASNAAICKQLQGIPEYQHAKTVFAFIGVGWEIDTRELLLHALSAGKRVAVPLCVGPGIMEARFIESLEDLAPGAYDIPEPKDSCPVCPSEEIDFAVIPCVSCNRSCHRLGQGGGFYDRFLEQSSFPNAAICRDIALEDEIPVEPWDRPVDRVVTETAIHRRS